MFSHYVFILSLLIENYKNELKKRSKYVIKEKSSEEKDGKEIFFR